MIVDDNGENLKKYGTVALSLVLLPTRDLLHLLMDHDKFTKFNSAECHVIDNFEFKLKLKSNGEVDVAEISFLLANRNFLKNRSVIVVDQKDQRPLFIIHRIEMCHGDEIKV